MYKAVDRGITKCLQSALASLTKTFWEIQTGKLDLSLQGTENAIQTMLSWGKHNMFVFMRPNCRHHNSLDDKILKIMAKILTIVTCSLMWIHATPDFFFNGSVYLKTNNPRGANESFTNIKIKLTAMLIVVSAFRYFLFKSKTCSKLRYKSNIHIRCTADGACVGRHRRKYE